MYQGFSDAVAGNYLPTETISDRLAEVIGDSSVLCGCTVFLDGYTGFTPSQYGLLKALFQKAENCYLTLTAEKTEGVGAEHGLFHLTLRTKQIVTGLAKEVGCEAETMYLPEGTVLPRFSGCFRAGVVPASGAAAGFL